MDIHRSESIKVPYGAYHGREVPPEDGFLTHVGPGTPCGEYLRRFWHPIAYSHELGDVPVRKRIMGEDLVVFRDRGGRVGLLQLHCCHRGTSLEYGRLEERGIRCCYHGWHFDTDGRILDTPLEPPGSGLKERFYQGAYLAEEHHGMVWGYLGPPDKVPDGPDFDLLSIPGHSFEPGELHGGPNHKPCNWLQIVDNFVDPQHEAYLHALHSGCQFISRNGRNVEELATPGAAEYLVSPTGIVTLEMRRVGPETVWVRNIEFIWPNIAVLGQIPEWPPRFAAGQDEIHDFPITLDWAVPMDDVNTMEMSLVLTPLGGENPRTRYPMAALESNAAGRPYEEMQRTPGDYEAQIGQRPIAVHANEHLGAIDKGVAMLRRGLREAIETVRDGGDPPNVRRDGSRVPTHASDAALRIPALDDAEADRAAIRRAGIDLAERLIARGGHVDLAGPRQEQEARP